MDHFLTISEAAELISKETLRRWDQSGKFPSSRNPINNYRVYPTSQVNQLIKDLKLEFYTKTSNETLGKPFLKTELGALYTLDVVRFLSRVEDETVDLIFADPPYNIKKAEWDSFRSQKQYVEWSLLWIREAHRVLKPNGTLYICGFSEILADIKWAANYLFRGCKWPGS